MYGGQLVVGGKIVSMWNTKVSLRYVRWQTCRWRQECFYVEYEGFSEICTVANMSLAASLFLCGFGGFTEICTVANMSLAARLSYVEYEGFTEICTVANMSLAARLFLCGI